MSVLTGDCQNELRHVVYRNCVKDPTQRLSTPWNDGTRTSVKQLIKPSTKEDNREIRKCGKELKYYTKCCRRLRWWTGRTTIPADSDTHRTALSTSRSNRCHWHPSTLSFEYNSFVNKDIIGCTNRIDERDFIPIFVLEFLRRRGNAGWLSGLFKFMSF